MFYIYNTWVLGREGMDILGPVNGSSKSFDGRRVGNLFCRENILQIELANFFSEGTPKELGLSSFVLTCFVVIVKVDVQFSPTNIRLVWRGSFLLPKGMDTLTDTSRYEVYTWGSSFISSKISSSSSSSRTTFSKTNREIQPTQLWVYPN